MRVERIDSLKDVFRWIGDQLAHTAMVVVVFAPIVVFGLRALTISAALMLIIREVEQWRGKSDGAKAKQALEPFIIRHLDRAIDVSLGAGLGGMLLWMLYR